MLITSVLRRLGLGTGALGCILAVSACKPVPVSLDNPKDGDSTQVAVDQDLAVRLSNMSGGKQVWTLDTPPSAAILAPQPGGNKPASNGSMPLDTFAFKGAGPGDLRLTFSYHFPGQPAASADDVINLSVKVTK